MLHDELPHKFCAEALATAVYLRNCSPTKAVEGMTLFDALTGEKSNVKYLKTFGCAAYAHVPKNEQQKLYSKSNIKGVFFGYGRETKGYRLYDLDHSRIFTCQDVLFNESSCGIENSTKQGETQSVIISTVAESVLRQSERERAPGPPNYYG